MLAGKLRGRMAGTADIKMVRITCCLYMGRVLQGDEMTGVEKNQKMSIREAQKVFLIEEQGLAAVRERIGGEFEKAVDTSLSLSESGGYYWDREVRNHRTKNRCDLEQYRDTVVFSPSGRGHAR